MKTIIANHFIEATRERVRSPMQDHVLESFREIAAHMTTGPADWEWVGPHMSQRMFGITQKRAEQYAFIYGGVARPQVKS